LTRSIANVLMSWTHHYTSVTVISTEQTNYVKQDRQCTFII